jgi:serine/threonine-protein kinase HipA
LVYRGHDVAALREFARRLAFNILISNGDAHLKNWSLIYRRPGVPSLAPAYDLVATRVYMGADEELGMKFGGARRFDTVNVRTFERLEQRLGAVDAALGDVVAALVADVRKAWPESVAELATAQQIAKDVADSIESRSRTLLAR